MITRVRAAYVIGFDGIDHVVYHQGEVVYEGERIVYVGHCYDGAVDETIEAGEAIVSPGFIDLDALADIDHALIDTWHGPETELGLQWSEDYFRNRRRDVFSPEDVQFRREFALVQLVRNGITTAMPIAAETHNGWAETYDELAGMAETGARLGLRLYLGPSYRSGVNVVRADGSRDVLWDEGLGEQGLRDATRFVRDFDGAQGGLIKGCLLPCRIETVTKDLMRATARAAEELDCLVRLHCLQGAAELRFLRRWYDQTALEVLDEVGLLGRRLLIPHAIYIGGHSRVSEPYRGELETLAGRGVAIIHCPMTSVRSGSVLESFDRYRAAGVKITLGTDTFPPDMIRVMNDGGNLTKTIEKRSNAGAAADFFRSATLVAAEALGRNDLGRLAAGAMADLIIVDLSDPRIGPIDDVIRTMVMNCTGANVRTVIIGGRVVMKDRKLPGVDDDAMRRSAQTYFKTMKEAYGERDYLRRPIGELFPPSLRVID